MTRMWPPKPLGDLFAPKLGSVDPSKYPDEKFDLYSIPAFDLRQPEIRSGSEIGSAKQTVQPQDVLLSRIVPHIRRAWIVGDERGRRLIASGEWIVFRSPSFVPGFLRHFLISDLFHGRFMQTVSGVGGSLLRAKVSEVAKIPIPVPPLAEQERIVALLDEANALSKLRAEADTRTATLIPALFHEMFVATRRSPFPRVPLRELGDVVSGVAKGRKFNGRLPVEVPYLRVANVQAGHLDLSEIKTIQALPEEIKELSLRRGDVLLTEGGDFDKLGRGAMLDHDLPNCIHQNHVFRVRVFSEKLDPMFFAKFLLTDEARGFFLGCAKKTTNLASINMTQLRSLPVMVPPIQHQRAFSTRVAEIREMEAAQAASRQQLDALFQSMLHRAFNGEL